MKTSPRRSECHRYPPHGGGARLLRALTAGLLLMASTSDAAIIFSEIADQGTASACDGGADWLELYNTDEDGTDAVDLSGYILHDDRGLVDSNRYTFPQGQQLAAGEYLVLCCGDTNDALTSPQFKIGGSDTLTLVNAAATEIITSIGPLPDGAERNYDVTYAWDSSSADPATSYSYTSTPTPGAANILTPVAQETPEQVKERLSAQNALGTQFFGMDDNGLPVEDGFGEVLDLHLTMEQDDYDYLIQNASFQLYRPFTSARVVRNNTDGTEEELAVLNSPGRIRPKGQSTLYIANCMGLPTMPFLVDFTNVNQSQTLFGVERLYMRTHMMDNSFMREWSAHRLLARFGLPHLRARTMRFFINGNRIGLYTVLEAVDQDYVFQRSFPNMDPENYALYKVKTLSVGCGNFEPERLEEAQLRLDEPMTTPYNFERGDHREPTTVRGPEGYTNYKCHEDFFGNLLEEWRDVELAYLRANEDCGKMLVDEGIIDRDMGGKAWDPIMQTFVNEHLAQFKCEDEECGNSDLQNEIDVDNFLKSFAFYATTLQIDSPLVNGNNYYLADAGDGTGWKIVGYDHNLGGGDLCSPTCNAHLPYWSILRPTCGPLQDTQLVGPLLTNATLHAQYIDYVRTFTNDVLGNESFVEEMTRHIQAIEEYVKEDPWSAGGQFLAAELSPDAADWNNNGTYPLLPFYKARVEEVRRQLEALDEETFARGPHLETNVAPFELCVDWRSTEAPESKCPQNCRYEGCTRSNLVSFDWCDEEKGICMQSDFDAECRGVPFGERYEGMKDKPDGRATFCSTVMEGVFPIKAFECPPFVTDDASSSSPGAGDKKNETSSSDPVGGGNDGNDDTSVVQDTTGSSATAAAARHEQLQALIVLVSFVSSWLFL